MHLAVPISGIKINNLTHIHLRCTDWQIAKEINKKKKKKGFLSLSLSLSALCSALHCTAWSLPARSSAPPKYYISILFKPPHPLSLSLALSNPREVCEDEAQSQKHRETQFDP